MLCLVLGKQLPKSPGRVNTPEHLLGEEIVSHVMEELRRERRPGRWVKNNPESMIVMQAKARLFAIQVGKKVPVVFYIPWEAYNVYRLSGDAFAWSVDLSVGGKQIELTKSNLKTMLSKSILKSSDPKQAYDSYKALIASASKANEGVLIPFPKAPYNVMFYEFEKGGNTPFPSYITE